MELEYTWTAWIRFEGQVMCQVSRMSCLENPRDRGACWAAVYGVAQSWTRLKRLSSSSNVSSSRIIVGKNNG